MQVSHNEKKNNRAIENETKEKKKFFFYFASEKGVKWADGYEPFTKEMKKHK